MSGVTQFLGSLTPLTLEAMGFTKAFRAVFLGVVGVVSSQAERDRLIDNAVCGAFNFSLSNDYIVNNNDIEYNKVQLQKQLEKGEVTYEISCQMVKDVSRLRLSAKIFTKPFVKPKTNY